MGSEGVATLRGLSMWLRSGVSYPKSSGLNSAQFYNAVVLWCMSWNWQSCGIRGHALKISTGGGLGNTDFSKGMPALRPQIMFEPKWVYLGCLLTDFGTQTGKEAHLWLVELGIWYLLLAILISYTWSCSLLWVPALLPGLSTPPALS